ncbi:MAG: 3-oxoacyl-ACP reductase FabG [Legionellales bacterium]|nr:3-oxoacyl-ACP reductase FabG [Legionellales bacterium]
MLSLENKIALVTGASRGIGAEILTQLGQAGATVIGSATSQAGVEKIEAQLRHFNVKGGGVILDVTQENSVNAALSSIQERFGHVEILVNNAGITDDNLFLRMKDEQWYNVIETNLNAIFRLSKHCLKNMIKARFGRIISISSVVGLSGNPGQTNYAAAKAGLIGFSKSLAMEVASRNITVNVVAPGMIETDMTAELNANQRQQILEHIPVGRMGSPAEIAAGVVFLASPLASYITGETLNINGGMYMS